MLAYFIAFISGVVTVLAPCVFPLLPIIIGSAATGKNLKKLFVIVGSLSISVFIFTILLRTFLIDNPVFSFLNEDFWRYASGTLITIFGFFSVFPEVWDRISNIFKFSQKSDKLLDEASQNKSLWGSALLGASLGPVFSSCSPTYFVIVGLLAAETDRVRSLSLLIVYIIGLALILILIGIFGQKLIKKLRWAANPNGIFKKGFGILLIVLGLMIFFRLDKVFEAWLLNFDVYNNLFQFENNLTDGGRKLN